MTTVDAQIDIPARLIHFAVRRELDILPATFDLGFAQLKTMAAAIIMEEAKIEQALQQPRDLKLVTQ